MPLNKETKPNQTLTREILNLSFSWPQLTTEVLAEKNPKNPKKQKQKQKKNENVKFCNLLFNSLIEC